MKNWIKILLTCFIFTILVTSFYIAYNSIEKHNLETHIALSDTARSLLPVSVLDSLTKPIYESVESNVRCNEAYYTAVFLTTDDLFDKCKEIGNEFPSTNWRTAQFCEKIEREEFNFFKIHLISRETEENGIDHFDASFYPKQATHPLFIPRTKRDIEILQKVREHNQPFFYISYHYNGKITDYKKNERCDGLVCPCTYSTYSYTRISGKEYRWIRKKIEQEIFN